MTGCRLTDGSVTYRFDDFTLGAGEYCLLFLGSENTGFALSASGRDSIQLQDPAGNIISQAKLQSVTADQVVINSDGTWLLSDESSLGFSNDREGRAAFRTGKAVESLPLPSALIWRRSWSPTRFPSTSCRLTRSPEATTASC